MAYTSTRCVWTSRNIHLWQCTPGTRLAVQAHLCYSIAMISFLNSSNISLTSNSAWFLLAWLFLLFPRNGSLLHCSPIPPLRVHNWGSSWSLGGRHIPSLYGVVQLSCSLRAAVQWSVVGVNLKCVSLAIKVYLIGKDTPLHSFGFTL